MRCPQQNARPSVNTVFPLKISRYAVPAGNSEALIKVIREKVLADKVAFERMGQNGRDYYEKNYRMDMCIDNLEKIIGVK